MKLLKISDIRGMDKAGLTAKVNELRSELFILRMKKKTTGLEKPHFIGVLRRNMARIYTVLHEKAKES